MWLLPLCSDLVGMACALSLPESTTDRLARGAAAERKGCLWRLLAMRADNRGLRVWVPP
jgi:hypothetical protein